MSNTVIPEAQRLEVILSRLEDVVPDLDKQTVVTGLALAEFASQTLLALETHFAKFGLSQGRFAVLMHLLMIEEEEWVPASLAEVTGVTRATMSGLLKTLEKDSWITRAVNPNDSRSTTIKLTRTGKSRLKKLLPEHFGLASSHMDCMSVADHQILLSSLDKAKGVLRNFGER